MVSARGPKMTLPVQLVLRTMIADPAREMYGLQLGQLAGLASGTVHPIMARLEGCGWVESRWEAADPHQAGRPRRRFYRLTPDGVVYAERALQRVRTPAPLLGRLSPDTSGGTT